MNVKKKLTKTVVDNLTIPEAGEAWAADTELDGFGVRVQPGGRKVYMIRYRTKGPQPRQRKMVIARCCDMPPEKARELARKAFAKVAEGIDPMEERRPTVAPENHATVARLFQAYVDNMKTKGRESAAEVERVLLKSKRVPNAADALGRNKPAAQVTPGDIVAFVATFYKAGHRGAADKARSYIASAFEWAIKSANDYTVTERQDWGVTTNPAAAVARDPEATRAVDRNLSVGELRRLWLATGDDMKGFDLEIASCIRILIGMGQRVQETLRIDGSEIDLDAMQWKMPIQKTKTKQRPHTVPIPAILVPTFQALKAEHGDGPLFPSRDGSKNDRIVHQSVNQAIGRWLAGVDVAHFTTRDIRRTWKSRAHDAGVDRFTRDLIQQHAKSDTGSKHYDHAIYLPQMTEAMGKWNDWLEGIINGAPVIKLAA